MQATERKEFAKLVESLLAGFNVPTTDARMDAYWRGCNGMHLLAFERTVNHVLGPNGEDELPTPRQLHAIHRRIVAEQRASSSNVGSSNEREQDIFEIYTGRVLFNYLRFKARRVGSGATDGSLHAMLEIRKAYADAYRQICVDEPEASLELRDRLVDALEAAFVPIEAKAPRLPVDAGFAHIGLFA